MSAEEKKQSQPKMCTESNKKSGLQQMRPTLSLMNNSFFEVTVNAEKLADIFNHINHALAEQNVKIQNLKSDCKYMFDAIENKIENQGRKNGMIFTKMEAKMGQNLAEGQQNLKEASRKLDQKDNQLYNRIQALANKMFKFEQISKDELKQGLFQLKKEIIGEIYDEASEQVSIKQMKLDEPISELNPFEQKKVNFSSIIKNFNEQIYKVKQSLKDIFTQMYHEKIQMQKQQHKKNMSNVSLKKQQQKNSNKQNCKHEFIRKMTPTNKNKTIAIGQKSGDTERVATPQSLDSNGQTFSRFGNKIRHMSYTKNTLQEELTQNYSQLYEKIAYIENYVQLNNPVLNEMKNRSTILEQKLLILSRKAEKNSQQVTEVKTNLRRIQNLKNEDKSIDELRNYLKWAVRDLEDKIGMKSSTQDLQKQRNKLTQKISIIHENLIQKADKTEIQKAIIFLESKIKQIIFLIAAEQSEEREGAIMKVATKCLSCDKQVERQLQMKLKSKLQQDKQALKKSDGNYVKSLTHRVRQKYKKQIAKMNTCGNESFEQH